MNMQRQRQQGMALVFVMIAIIIVLGALGLVMAQVQSARKEADFAYNQVLLEEAVQAGIDMAIQRLWGNYVQTTGNTTRNWASYRYYLNNELEIPINEDLNFNGTQDPDETGNGDGTFDVYPTGYDSRGWSLLEGPFEFKDPETQRVISTLDNVHIARYDQVAMSLLTVTATANVGGQNKTAVQILSIGGAEMPHTQFAVLANNISCLLCHAEIRSLKLEQNTDPSRYGSFDRVKIAALESMLVRPTEAMSNVAGTVYTRGRVYKDNGQPFTANELRNSTFKAYNFSKDNGKIIQGSSGAMNLTSLTNASTNDAGDLEQFSNLYMDYPTDPLLQTDGPLPNSFPAPYPDENNNRYVDDDEFDVIVNSANGRVRFEFGESDGSGSITAGVAFGVPKGTVYSGTSLPVSSNSAINELSATGSYDGNLILVGTDSDPIIIEKTVAINGDLVLKGPIRGYGQLLVRGNTYIVGDVTYADAPGEFGVDVNGNENAFALVAGGSIMMGDYLTVRGVNHSALNNDKFPQWNQYSIHMREANRSNNVKINNKTETLKWGYFDPWSVDPGGPMPQLKNSPTGRPGDQFSFTTSELKLFNELELSKALTDPNYTPRFYGLRASQPNNIYIYDSNDEHAVRYSESAVKLLSQYLIEKGYPLDILNRAAYHYCSPDQNWISENTLRQIWYQDEMTRPSSGRPFKFDGLLYSNNSIWNIVRSYTRHYSNTKGKMLIRGGVIAADLGVFVPEGFFLHYDPRVERFLEIRDTSVVAFHRRAFFYTKSDNA